MVIKSLIPFLFLCLVAACSSEVKQPFSLDYVYKADPISDANKAIKKGDFHFFAINGIGRFIPSVNRRCLTHDTKVIPILGTTEIITSYEEAQFNVLATTYAEYYNRTIVTALQKSYVLDEHHKTI